MSKYIKFTFNTLALTALCATTLAYAGQMMSYPDTNLWDGFYIGVNAGGAWGSSEFGTSPGSVVLAPIPSYFTNLADINSIIQSGSGRVNASSAIGGLQAGSSVFVNKFIVGLVVDLGLMRFRDSINAVNVPFPSNPAATYNLKSTMNTDWLFTGRASLGYLVHNWVSVYATGGVAVSKFYINHEYSDSTNAGQIFSATQNENKAGWTAGAGLQIPMSRCLFVNAEYLYVQFTPHKTTNQITCLGGPCASPLTTKADLNANLIRVGINYKFS